MTKFDHHFHDLFGQPAEEEDDVNEFADNPRSVSRSKESIIVALFS